MKESNKEIIDKKEFENIMLKSAILKRDKFIEKIGVEKSFNRFIEEENRKELNSNQFIKNRTKNFELEL